MDLGNHLFAGPGMFAAESKATGQRFRYRVIPNGRFPSVVRQYKPRRRIGQIVDGQFKPLVELAAEDEVRGFAWLWGRMQATGLIPPEVDVLPVHTLLDVRRLKRKKREKLPAGTSPKRQRSKTTKP